MKSASILLAASAFAAGAASFSVAANAAPITLPSSLQSALTSPVEAVQWRRWGGWRGWGPGLAAGAIIGGAIAASQPWYGYNNYYDDYAYAPGYSYSYAPSYSYSYGSGPSGYNSYNYNNAPSGYSYSYGSAPSSYNSYAYSPGYRSRYSIDYGTTPGYNYSPSGYNSRSYAPSTSSSYAAGDPSYCKQRFRSYDPASGTYLGYDGRRHPCP